MTAPCATGCPRLVILAKRHVAILRLIQSDWVGVVTVHDREVISRMHVGCAERIGMAPSRPAEARDAG